MILSNQAECLLCGDKPYSMTRHHYAECSCGNISVDGGMDYCHHSFKDKDNYRDMSVEWDNELVIEMCGELDGMIRTQRNVLGLTCAVARVLRDNGYVIHKVEKECNSEI